VQPKHEKHTTYEKQVDGSVKITGKSYFEELSHILEEIEKQTASSFQTLKQDVDLALKHVTEDGSPKLVLTIEIKKGQPRITKRYVTLRQDFKHR
jgi:hypothetical protein